MNFYLVLHSDKDHTSLFVLSLNFANFGGACANGRLRNVLKQRQFVKGNRDLNPNEKKKECFCSERHNSCDMICFNK